MRKDSLIKGTIILALAAFIARFLGVIQRVPLQNMLGDAGMATYGIAYNIYFLLLIVATAGIPSTLSKLVSEKTAIGAYDEASRIYRAAVWFAVSAGIIITAVLYLIAPYYAVHISKDPEAVLSIQALAPAMLLFPLIAIMRGYFQGRQIMMAGGLSQIFEQILRVVTAVGLAYVFLKFGFSREWAAAGASFGGVMGAVAAFIVMLYFARKLKRTDATERLTDSSAAQLGQHELYVPESPYRVHPTAQPSSYRSIYASIFKLSIPISLISIAVPLIYFIDSSTVIAFIQHQVGYEEAKVTLGILTGKAQSIAGIPPILAIALSMSIVPIVSAAFARNNLKEVNDKASQALKISVVSGLPLVLALMVAAEPINGLLFTDTKGSAIIVWMVAGSIFQIVMMTSGAILMGLGQTTAPMIHVFIGIAVKLVGSWLLAKSFGIYGILLATMLCFVVTMLLNLHYLRRSVQYSILGKKWPVYTGIVMVTIAIGYSVQWLGRQWIHSGVLKLDYFIQASVTCAVMLAVYPILLFLGKVFTAQDIAAMPKPVRRLLQRFMKQTEAGE